MSEATAPETPDELDPNELAAKMRTTMAPRYMFEGLDPESPRHLALFQYAAISRYIGEHPGLVGYKRSAYEHLLLHLSIKLWPIDMREANECFARVLKLQAEESKTAGRQLTPDELEVKHQRELSIRREVKPSVVAPGGWLLTLTHSKLVDLLLDIYNAQRELRSKAGLQPTEFANLVAGLTREMLGTPRELHSLTEAEAQKILDQLSTPGVRK